jgi:V8-like Glu-specific endopeptidase
MRILFVAIFFLSLNLRAQSRVENGTVAPAAAPISRSVAFFKLSKGGSCSATFLTEKVLLTAGHCTDGTGASGSQIRIRDSGGKRYSAKVAEVHTHPQYSLQSTAIGAIVNNDVGVVVLQDAFPVSVRPLRLGGVSQLEQRPTEVTVAGYGWSGKGSGAGTLRHGKMIGEIEKLENFTGREGIRMVPKDDQIVCPGDSGGAVLRGDENSTVIIGVHSLSTGCQGAAPEERVSMSEIAIAQKAWIQSVAPEVP